MELNHLKTFQTIATHHSFSKAAEELHLTQPAVTLQMKNLETELGELLIDRVARSINLTPAGEVFLSYTQQILNLSEEAYQTLQQFSSERGRLTIGAATTTTIFRLPEILHHYHEKHPKIEIHIRNGASNLVNKMVHENAVDLGLVTTIDLSLNLHTAPVFGDEIWLLAPSGYKAEIAAEELEKESLILFGSGSGFRRFLEDQFQQYHFVPKVSMELESIEGIIRFVQMGLGLAFLPEIAVREEVIRGSLKKVKICGWNIMTRKTFLIYRRDKYLNWPVKAFLNCL